MMMIYISSLLWIAVFCSTVCNSQPDLNQASLCHYNASIWLFFQHINTSKKNLETSEMFLEADVIICTIVPLFENLIKTELYLLTN